MFHGLKKIGISEVLENKNFEVVRHRLQKTGPESVRMICINQDTCHLQIPKTLYLKRLVFNLLLNYYYCKLTAHFNYFTDYIYNKTNNNDVYCS